MNLKNRLYLRESYNLAIFEKSPFSSVHHRDQSNSELTCGIDGFNNNNKLGEDEEKIRSNSDNDDEEDITTPSENEDDNLVVGSS